MGSLAQMPIATEAFRKSTKTYRPMNHAMKKCAGPCNRLRSVGQFAAGDDLCAICRRRA